MKMALMNEITGPHNLYHDNASGSKTGVDVTVMWETQEWMLESCGKDWGGASLKHLDSQTVQHSVKQPWLPQTSSYEAFCPCFPEVGRAYRAELEAC